jgi:hypothetical protein
MQYQFAFLCFLNDEMRPPTRPVLGIMFSFLPLLWQEDEFYCIAVLL